MLTTLFIHMFDDLMVSPLAHVNLAFNRQSCFRSQKPDHLCSREPKSLTQATIMINQTIGQWNYVSQYTKMIFNITYDHISSYYHWSLLFLLVLWLLYIFLLWLLPLLLLLHNHIVFLCIYRMSFGMWCWKVCKFLPARMTSDVQLGFVFVWVLESFNTFWTKK